MHGVAADILTAHGAERAIPHVQGHLAPAEPPLRKTLPELVGEMQAGCGRGHGSYFVLARVDGLIAVRIIGHGHTPDIGRKRNASLCLVVTHEIALPEKIHGPAAGIALFPEHNADVVPEGNSLTCVQMTSAAHESGRTGSVPAVTGLLRVLQHNGKGRKQKKFHPAARSGTHAPEAGRQNA